MGRSSWTDARGDAVLACVFHSLPTAELSAGFAEGRVYERGLISWTRGQQSCKVLSFAWQRQRPQPQQRGFRETPPGSSKLRWVGVVHRRPDRRSSSGASRGAKQGGSVSRFGPQGGPCCAPPAGLHLLKVGGAARIVLGLLYPRRLQKTYHAAGGGCRNRACQVRSWSSEEAGLDLDTRLGGQAVEDWTVCTYVCICGGNLDGAVGCWS
jgi:hypothetical protein